MKKTDKSSKSKERDLYIKNRDVFYDYIISSDNIYEAGIALQGCEIKSILQGNISFSGAYCRISDRNEISLVGMYIKRYENGSVTDMQDEYRERKLLLHKDEIRRIRKVINEKGWTIVPVNIHLSKGGSVNVSGISQSKKKNIIKIDIAVAQGAKKYDKREKIKEKDTARIADKEAKYRN